MKYDSIVITNDGGSFLAQTLANKKAPVLDKMIILNNDLSGKTLESLTMQDFSNGLSFDVNNVSQNSSAFTATSVIKNTGITEDYPAKTIGITGFTDGQDAKLLAVAQGTDPFIVEKQTDTPITLTPSITVGFSNTSNINLTVKEDVFLTMANLQGTLMSIGFAKQDYVDTQDKATLQSATEYTDKKVGSIDLSSTVKQVNDYADNHDKQTLQSAESYADKKSKYFDDAGQAYKALSTVDNNTFVFSKGKKATQDSNINMASIISSLPALSLLYKGQANDANNLSSSGIYDGHNMANSPGEWSIIFNFQASKIAGYQGGFQLGIVFWNNSAPQNQLFFRTKNGSWFDWKQIV